MMHEVPAVLDAAIGYTKGDRHSDYGPAAVNLGERTADLFSAYVRNMSGREFTATDVCNLMILVKVARLMEHPVSPHFDSLVDIAGYASSAWEATHG
jgi:hypothetical protein